MAVAQATAARMVMEVCSQPLALTTMASVVVTTGVPAKEVGIRAAGPRAVAMEAAMKAGAGCAGAAMRVEEGPAAGQAAKREART